MSLRNSLHRCGQAKTRLCRRKVTQWGPPWCLSSSLVSDPTRIQTPVQEQRLPSTAQPCPGADEPLMTLHHVPASIGTCDSAFFLASIQPGLGAFSPARTPCTEQLQDAGPTGSSVLGGGAAQQGEATGLSWQQWGSGPPKLHGSRQHHHLPWAPGVWSSSARLGPLARLEVGWGWL